MRIYEGQVYSFNSAVDTSDFYCEFLDIKSPRTAYIHYGNKRFWSIGNNSRMILHFQNKKGKWGDRIVKIPFEKIGGRLEFDYPDYLKASGIAYQLKNSQEGILNACGSNYHLVYSKNANISIGCVEFMDYSDYSFMVQYKKPVLYINGKRVTFIETSYDFDDKLMDLRAENSSIEEVITLLETTGEIPIEFDPAIWRIVVEKVLVGKDNIRFIMIGGKEYSFRIY